MSSSPKAVKPAQNRSICLTCSIPFACGVACALVTYMLVSSPLSSPRGPHSAASARATSLDTSQHRSLTLPNGESIGAGLDINSYPLDPFPFALCADILAAPLSSSPIYSSPLLSLRPARPHPVMAARVQYYMEHPEVDRLCMRGFDKAIECPTDEWRMVIGIATALYSFAPGDSGGASAVGLKHVIPLLDSLPAALHPAYAYRIYVAYDVQDRMYKDVVVRSHVQSSLMQSLYGTAPEGGAYPCGSHKPLVNVHWVMCADCTNSVARAEGLAAAAALLEGAEYVYRAQQAITLPPNTAWTYTFIDTLLHRHIPNFGIVLPRGAGVSDINLPEFIHRSHLWLFGYYFPASLTDRAAYAWMQHVYGQFNASVVLDGPPVSSDTLVDPNEPMSERVRIATLAGEVRNGRDVVDKFVSLLQREPLRNFPRVLLPEHTV